MTEEKRGPGRPRKVQQGNAAEAPAPVAPEAPVEGFAAWIHGLERRKLSEGVVLVSITHPEATGEIHVGTYSGIRTAVGPVSALWSDGSTI